MYHRKKNKRKVQLVTANGGCSKFDPRVNGKRVRLQRGRGGGRLHGRYTERNGKKEKGTGKGTGKSRANGRFKPGPFPVSFLFGPKLIIFAFYFRFFAPFLP
jgi:hypothetical protein